jgi:hypothetical protein
MVTVIERWVWFSISTCGFSQLPMGLSTGGGNGTVVVDVGVGVGVGVGTGPTANSTLSSQPQSELLLTLPSFIYRHFSVCGPEYRL